MMLKAADPSLQILVLPKQIEEHGVDQVGLQPDKEEHDLLGLVSFPAPHAAIHITLKTAVKHVSQIDGLQVPGCLELLLDGPKMCMRSIEECRGITGDRFLDDLQVHSFVFYLQDYNLQVGSE